MIRKEIRMGLVSKIDSTYRSLVEFCVHIAVANNSVFVLARWENCVKCMTQPILHALGFYIQTQILVPSENGD